VLQEHVDVSKHLQSLLSHAHAQTALVVWCLLCSSPLLLLTSSILAQTLFSSLALS